jgi:hypothetical protein
MRGDGDDAVRRKVCPFICLTTWALTRKLCLMSVCAASSSPPSPFSGTFHLITMTTEIQCPGCEKRFSPRGLSQHISKSRDARCHRVGAPLASQAPAVSFPHMDSAQPPHPVLSRASGGAQGRPDDNLERQLTIGEFTATRASHRILKIFQMRYDMRPMSRMPMSRMRMHLRSFKFTPTPTNSQEELSWIKEGPPPLTQQRPLIRETLTSKDHRKPITSRRMIKIQCLQLSLTASLLVARAPHYLACRVGLLHTSHRETRLCQYGPLFILKKTGRLHIGSKCVAQVHRLWTSYWLFQMYAPFSYLSIVSNL